MAASSYSLADGQQPRADDHHGVGELVGHQADHLAGGAEGQRRGQHGDHEQQRHRDQDLGQHEGDQHREVGTGRDPAPPAVQPERQATPRGTVIAVASTPSSSVWVSAACRLASCQTEPQRVAVVPAHREALPGRARPAGVEREQHRDQHRHQRPDQVPEGDRHQHPRLAPRVAPPRAHACTMSVEAARRTESHTNSGRTLDATDQGRACVRTDQPFCAGVHDCTSAPERVDRRRAPSARWTPPGSAARTHRPARSARA